MKFYLSRLFTTLSTFCLFGLIVLLSACNPQSANTSTRLQQNTNPSHKTPTTHQTTSKTSQVAAPTEATTQTTPLPQTDTSCPAVDTVRAAVMSPLVLGKDENIIYSDSATFKRYDIQTQLTTTILSLPGGTASNIAQISADGQWILFISSQTNAQTKLQLVRMDGQELQTLYCFTNRQANGHDIQDLQDPIQWSPDEKLIAIAVKNNDQYNTSSIFLLDITTGTLNTLFQGSNNDFYGKISWLDNTHLYVDSEVRSTGAQGTLFLMDVTTASAHTSNFQTILTYTANTGLTSYDSSSDGKNVVFSFCKQNLPLDTTITVKSATGDQQQASFHENACIPTVQAISPNTLFMLAQISNGTNGTTNEIWTMHFDGSGQQVLATLSPTMSLQGISYNLNQYSLSSWANISRDGNNYAITEINYGGSDQGVVSHSILIGSLSGGNPSRLEIPYPNGGNGEVNVVGWTTM